MNTIIAIAELDEMKLVKELMPDYRGRVIITGVGIVNVVKALRDVPKDNYIINVGYAGSNIIPVGTIVQITHSETAHELADFKDGEEMELFPLGKGMEMARCYTGTDFITKWNGTDKAVFDMELAGIVALGFEKLSSFKKISDNLSYKQYKEHIK